MATKPKRIRLNRPRVVRKTTAERGYNSRWQAASKRYRRSNPYCVDCAKRGLMRKAECVDHITPHCGNNDLMWDASNWQSLCWRCHSIKTRREQIDGVV